MTDPNRPLWRVMHKAQMDADPFNNTKGYAAELRAIAGAAQLQFDKHMRDADPVLLEVVDWLLAEADKAEAAAVYEQARETNHMRKNRGTTAYS